MEITGIEIREAIRKHQVALDVLERGWKSEIIYFPGEQEKDAKTLGLYDASIMMHERSIAALQAAQDYYNSHVYVSFGGGEITLAEAVVLIGATTRQESRMRHAASPLQDRRGSYFGVDPLVRDKDSVAAIPAITRIGAVEIIGMISTTISDLRKIVAEANVKSVDIKWLTPDVL